MSIDRAFEDLLRRIVREEFRAAIAELAQPAARAGEPETEYVDDRGLARWIGVSRETLQAMRRGTDGPPFTRVARRAVRYRVQDVRAWLETKSTRPRTIRSMH